jgi:hypothetical protein
LTCKHQCETNPRLVPRTHGLKVWFPLTWPGKRTGTDGHSCRIPAHPGRRPMSFRTPGNKSDRSYKLHLGERSNDLKRLPTASCRQCQTSALSFVGFLPALCFGSLLLVRRGGDAAGVILALAFCQCWSATFLTVSGLADGVSAGIGFAAGAMISVSARALGSSSLSDFADSFGANACSVLL